MNEIKLVNNQKFESRAEIGALLGGDLVKGIVTTEKINGILLFINTDEIYTDYFYPKGTYDYCMYTGIGRNGHQDSIENNMYDLNIEVLSHRKAGKPILIFEKKKHKYHFVGEYLLTETHQNLQQDENYEFRRVFVFHLKKIADDYKEIIEG